MGLSEGSQHLLERLWAKWIIANLIAGFLERCKAFGKLLQLDNDVVDVKGEATSHIVGGNRSRL